MKKISLIAILLVFVISLSGCVKEEKDTGKLNICTMIFCEYDFAKAITKDKADITLLVKPGTESHSYEPETKDMINATESDVFIYTSVYMKAQAEKILNAVKNDNMIICDTSENIELRNINHAYEETHHEDVEPHIWTSPVNAIKMVGNICDKICEADKENEEFYRENANAYIMQLKQLDVDFQEVLKEKENKKMIFGSRFPLLYFTQEYNISYDSAFDDCSGETEPGVKVMARLIEEIKNENITTVFYTEMSDTKVADALCEETNAKKALFHSCHNVTKDEFERGETYVSLMEKNVEALKDGLK